MLDLTTLNFFMEEKRKAITQVFGGIIVGINKYIMKVWNELA